MLSAFRAFAKSWVAAVLVGLLIVSFAVFGLNDVLNGRAMGDAVIKAGSRSITSTEFRGQIDRYRQDLEQRTGQPVTAEMLDREGMIRRALEEIATGEALAELIDRMGIRISDKLFAAQMQKIPAFFDPVSGRFDRRQFERVLSENNVTEQQFERQVRDQTAATHLQSALVNGLRAPRAYSAMAAVFMLETRDFGYFVLPASSVPAPPAPTDAQLQAFMQENAAQLTRPEQRTFQLVRFSPADQAAGVAVTEEDLRKRYDFVKDTLSTPERRTVVQIPAKNAAAAQQAVERLRRGEEPAAIAKSLGVEAITHADKPQTAIADRKVAAAAFGMPSGQAAVVQGDLGPAAVQVVSVTPGQTVTFEQARPQLEAELKRDAATEKALALSQAYDDARQAGANLAEAARRAGVPVATVGTITKDGQTESGAPPAGLTQKILDTAFATPAGGESELIDNGGGDYFAVRVERIIPAALPPLAEVRADLARVWTMRQTATRLENRAAELAARVRRGEALEAVAASAGAQVVRLNGISRQNVGQQQNTPQSVMAQALALKAGEAFTARTDALAFAVGKVDAVRAAEGSELPQGVELARNQMTQPLIQEMLEGAQRAARTKVKVRIDEERARAALGLAPAQAANGRAEKTK